MSEVEDSAFVELSHDLRTWFSASKLARCVLDTDGQILAMNAAARRLLARSEGLESRSGRLRARDPEADQRLARILRLRSGAVGAAVFPDDEGRVTEACLLERAHADGRWVVALWRPRGRTRRSILSPLHAHFGLTPSQGRVAELLLMGQSVAKIAGTLGVTVDTARSHLKAIYAKTGAGSQTAVVAAYVSVFLA